MRSSVLVLGVMAAGSIASARRVSAGTPAPIEGRVRIAHLEGSERPVTNADAVFARAPLWGTAIATDGPCTLYARPVKAGLSAGKIGISDRDRAIILDERRSSDGVTYRHATPLFADGATIDVESSGGTDVPAFRAAVTIPARVTGYAAPASLPRAGFTLTWDAHPGSEMSILIAGVNRRARGGVVLVCDVSGRGAFTVPASTLALIPPAFDQALVIVTRVARTVQTAGDARVTVEAVRGVVDGPLPITATPPPTVSTPPRRYLSIGLGLGGVSRDGDVPPTQGRSYRVQLGQRIGRGLHVVEEIASFGSGYISPFRPEASETHSAFGVGIRWTPFAPRPRRGSLFRAVTPAAFVDTTAFYVTGLVGANARNRETRTTGDPTLDVAWSPMASVALGLQALQGHDWGFGPEFREQLAYYDGELQRGWMVTFVVHMNGG